jgi:PAS domain S-box-containing protein
MAIPISIFMLVAVFTLSLFLGILSFLFWRAERHDHTPLWLTIWLGLGTVFVLCRLLQYTTMSDIGYIVTPRILLTASYLLAWVGYELGNSFVSFHPTKWERSLVILSMITPIIVLWISDFILTDQIIFRTIALGGGFRGVSTGFLYLPFNLLILAIGSIPPTRLLRTKDSHKRENILMACGFIVVILFSLLDFSFTSLNLPFIRLSDYSYLPIAIVFSINQVKRFSKLYTDMDIETNKRTTELRKSNESLTNEVIERKRVNEELNKITLQLQTLIDHVQTGILFENVERRILMVNQAFCELFGIDKPASSLIGMNCKEAAQSSKILINDPEGFIKRIEFIIKEKKRILAEELELVNGRMLTRDYIPVIANDGNSLGHLWQYSDISNRRNAEIALKESEKFLRQVIDLVPHFIFAKDEKSRFLMTNQAVANNYGTNTTSIVGKSDIDFSATPKEAKHFHEDDVAVIKGNRAKFIPEEVITDAKGNLRYLQTTKIPFKFGPKKQPALLGVAVDITERKQAEEKLRIQAYEMTTLYETTHDLIETKDLHKLLDMIVRRATKLLNASGGALYLCESEKQQVRCVVSHSTPEEFSGIVLNYGEGAAGKAAVTNEPIALEDYRHWKGRATKFKDPPFIAMLSVPLSWHESVIGVLQLIQNETRKFTQKEIRLVSLFANQAAVAIENSRLIEEEERHRKESDALIKISRDISGSLRISNVLNRIALHAKNILRTETSAIYLIEQNTNRLTAIAAIGPDAEEIRNDPVKVGEGILGNIAGEKKGEIVNDVNKDLRAITIQGTAETPFEHVMGVPVMIKNRLIGLIAEWRIGEGEDFSRNELNFLASLSGEVAVAIENARLFEEEERRRKESDTLREATEKITATLNQEQTIQIILEQLSKVVSYESASLQLLENNHLKVVGGSGWNDPNVVLGMSFPVPGDNPNTQVILERRAITLGNAPEVYSLFTKSPHNHIRSWLGVPMISQGNIIGMFAVDHSKPNFFTDTDIKMVQAFAGQAAIAIENTRLFEKTHQRLIGVESVHSISVSLRAANTLADALPIILDRLIELFNAKGAAVEVIASNGYEIVTELAKGVWKNLTGHRSKPIKGITKIVIETGNPFIKNKSSYKEGSEGMELYTSLPAIACVPVVAQELPIGAMWIGRQDPIQDEDTKLLASIGEIVGATIRRMSLHEKTERLLYDLQIANRNLERSYDTTLEGWAKALELRDKETEGHSRRMSDLTVTLAREVGIPESDLIHVRRGVLLHDIGKMGVSDLLLRKPTSLTEEEWDEMRKHPQLAYDLLSPIVYLKPALDIPYCHHEKWDGTGYPRLLKGDQIPIAARVFAVVDVYDALLSRRPYRKAWPKKKVIDYIHEQSGKQFDPKIVDAFFKVINKKKL